MTASATYHLLRDSQRLLLSRDEVRWQSQFTGTEAPADVVVNFGCGLQLTPHLMLEIVDVLTALGVPATTVAGPQWCCGMPVEDENPAMAITVARASVRHLARFQPKTTIQSCGAWWPQTARLCDGGEDIPFDLVPLPEFIMNALRCRSGTIAWTGHPSRRVLVHLKSQDATPEERIERSTSLSAIDRAIPAILGMIPSVTIVGQVEPPSPGSPCQADAHDRSILHDVSPEGRARVLAELAEQGARANASVIVCAHHRCAQEWGKFSSADVEVRHYVSVLADAMGLARPDRYHRCWSLPSVMDIVDETEPYWRSWDLSRVEAASLAALVFPTHPRSLG